VARACSRGLLDFLGLLGITLIESGGTLSHSMKLILSKPKATTAAVETVARSIRKVTARYEALSKLMNCGVRRGRAVLYR
jgi:hypothetical protein